jgi:hypothetical protein
MYTDKEKNDFITLRAEGFSFDKISKKLKIPKLTLVRWFKEKEKEINLLKETAFESLMESLKVSTSNRIQLIANDINKLNSILNKRSYDYGGTIDLIKLRIFLIKELSKFDSSFKFLNVEKLDENGIDENKLEPESEFCAKNLKEFKERVKDKLEFEPQASLDFEPDDDEDENDDN